MRSTFTNGAVMVRPFLPSDSPSFQQAARASAKTVGRWLSWCHRGFSRVESDEWMRSCQEHWARGISYEFGIFNAVSQEVWGGVGINQISTEHNFANLGYWVRAGCTGQGVASSAARWAAEFAFHLGFVRVEIVVQVGNLASQRVAQKLGATLEGTLRNRLFVEGRAFDAVMYSLVPSDDVGRLLAPPSREPSR